MAHMTTVNCKCCGNRFEARTADVNRGWGRFCSKSCKAIKQTKETKISGPDYRASGRTTKQMKSGKYTKSLFSGGSRRSRVIERHSDGTETFFANFSNEEGSDI